MWVTSSFWDNGMILLNSTIIIQHWGIVQETKGIFWEKALKTRVRIWLLKEQGQIHKEKIGLRQDTSER